MTHQMTTEQYAVKRWNALVGKHMTVEKFEDEEAAEQARVEYQAGDRRECIVEPVEGDA